MRRRLDLAGALVHEPRVLFLDEPTTGLDPKSRRDIWAEVRRLNVEEKVTVFLTTQYLEEADALAGRLAIIDGGRIVAEGPPEALKAEIGADVVRIEIAEGSGGTATQAVSDLAGLQDSSVDGTTLTLFLTEGPERIAEVLRRLDRGAIATAAVLMALAATAWAALLWSSYAGDAAMPGMNGEPNMAGDGIIKPEALEPSFSGFLLTGAAFGGGWVVMMAAMMLPSAGPMVRQ
jgi:hypothetical protein